MKAPSAVTTFLFTDIEGSSRLWEEDPERMRLALARHDAIARAAVEANRGAVVKMSGDGVHAVFADPLDAVAAAVDLQQELVDPASTGHVALKVRCGLHVGVDERRDNDFFGKSVNRAARIMRTAHGGQVLISQAMVVLIRDRLPTDIALRDLGTVRLRDLASPERVYQVLHRALRQEFPALRTLESVPNNLPYQVTSFVGRERELAEAKQLLANSRLLTLVGAGGIGKTRMSLQVAADVVNDYPDGVWFVELAPLSDASRVPLALASVLGVKEEPGLPLPPALMRHLKDRQPLVILDNCEHLIHACAELAKQLLQSSPHLKILASSREHLHLSGEVTFSVPPLLLPDKHKTLTRDELARYEAVRLFTDRATAAQPAFQLTVNNANALGAICHQLDGIPLAIELAAARVRALSVTDIAARLNDRFRLLTGGDRTALPRQQTLRALIDWSYDLLAENEQVLLQRLSVFSGGWSADAAEIVGAGGSIDTSSVLDLLTHLVEKSLLTLDAEGGRYRLLETVRQYAEERLNQSGEGDEIRTQHLVFYLGFAEKTRPELVGPNQGIWLARLDLERENVLSAHAWCGRAEGDAELGLRLVSSMRRYWLNRGLLALGHRVTVEALARPGAQKRGSARCGALFDAGQLGSWMGRYQEAQGYLEESLAIAREIADKRLIAVVLQPLAMASLGQGDFVAARGYLEEALALARDLGNKRELAAALNALAQVHRAERAPNMAEPLYKQVLTLARELEDREIIAIALLNLAMVSIDKGSGDRARSALIEVRAIAEEIGSKPAAQSVLEVCAALGALTTEWQRTARFFGAAEAQTRETGLHRDPTDEAFLAPLIAKARAAMGESAYVEAEAAGGALSYEEVMAEARAWLENGP